MAIWFQWKDNPAGSLWYGVVDSAGVAKQSYADYQRFERFEGIYANGTTNTGIQTNFTGVGQALLGDPFDNGHGPWVYPFLNGYAQDYDGGSDKKLTLMNSTNGTFELNDLHGLWSFYNTNNGSNAFGYLLNNEFTYGSGTRQDFSLGFMTWDAVNHVVWYPAVAPPTLLTQPWSQTVDQGANVTLSLTATSAVSMTFQWRFNGAGISGATNSSLTFSNIQPVSAGNYSVIASNYGGSSASSNAFLAVRPLLALDLQGVLRWGGSFTLQSASNVAGPFYDIPAAASPYTNSGSAPVLFFRLRN
jgi:hypothetical protein